MQFQGLFRILLYMQIFHFKKLFILINMDTKHIFKPFYASVFKLTENAPAV